MEEINVPMREKAKLFRASRMPQKLKAKMSSALCDKYAGTKFIP